MDVPGGETRSRSWTESAVRAPTKSPSRQRLIGHVVEYIFQLCVLTHGATTEIRRQASRRTGGNDKNRAVNPWGRTSTQQLELDPDNSAPFFL